MSLTNSLKAYKDCADAFEQALGNSQGIRIKFTTPSAAIHFRMRLHQYRKLDRESNAKIYPDPNHPNHGTSMYDPIVCRIQDNYLYMLKILSIPGEVELLGPPAEDLYVDYQEVKELTHAGTSTVSNGMASESDTGPAPSPADESFDLGSWDGDPDPGRTEGPGEVSGPTQESPAVKRRF